MLTTKLMPLYNITPVSQGIRGMATLKDIAVRLKSVKNIQKITKSMKMVSAAKYARAERELRPAKAYGKGAQDFYEKAEVDETKIEGAEKKPVHILMGMTSDRGLCGAANTSIVKAIRLYINEKGDSNVRLVAIGDKARSLMQRQHPNLILMQGTEVGRKPATFLDASRIANALINSGVEFNKISMYFNTFKSVVSYDTTVQPLYSLEAVSASERIALYDSVDDDVLRSYNEFLLTSLIFYAMKEASASEQSARMTAMENATKNAGEMIDKLTLLFNRTRQAAITRELTEIISGAAAV